MGRSPNGDFIKDDGDADADADNWRPLLYGAKNAEEALPVIAKAATAILAAGNALSDIAQSLKKISDDTARAISDTVELRKHLKAITAREQVLRDNVSTFTANGQVVEQRLRAIEKRLPPSLPKKKRRRR
jgi:septal ring factor EnvC (AmiA/AmiB activator)